jgi:hypothetical protein
MSYEMLESPVELTEAELDAITGGARAPRQKADASLLAVQVQCVDVNVNVNAIGDNNQFDDSSPC